jgi:hypothetical protein
LSQCIVSILQPILHFAINTSTTSIGSAASRMAGRDPRKPAAGFRRRSGRIDEVSERGTVEQIEFSVELLILLEESIAPQPWRLYKRWTSLYHHGDSHSSSPSSPSRSQHPSSSTRSSPPHANHRHSQSQDSDIYQYRMQALSRLSKHAWDSPFSRFWRPCMRSRR